MAQPRRHYGWKLDSPDARDQIYRVTPVQVATLPRHIDLTSGCSPVEDQGSLGSCTGNASVGALEFLEIKTGAKFVELSRIFAYYQGRAIEGTVRQDAGAEIRDVIKGLAKLGTCAEALCPYDVSRFTAKPSVEAYADAAHRRITSYQRVAGLSALRACLAEGYPFVLGFTVFESFESEHVARTGVVPMPKKNERELGGHAVLAVGYDDAARQLIVRNSWGVDWGQKGYFRLPYGYIENASLSDDFWTIRK